MSRKAYLIFTLSILVAIFFAFTGEFFSSLMANDAPQGAQQSRLTWYYSKAIFGPLALPSQPIPTVAIALIPKEIITYISPIAGGCFFLQIGLVIRRLSINLFRPNMGFTPDIKTVWKVMIYISFTTWIIGLTVLLAPRALNLIFEGELINALNYASAIGSAFILPVAWLIASFFGFVFFIVELTSIRKEGLYRPVAKKRNSQSPPKS